MNVDERGERVLRGMRDSGAHVDEDMPLHRPDEGQPMQPHEPDGSALQVRARGELRARLDPPHQGAAVKRAVEVQLSCADGLDLVNVGEMRVPPSFRRGAVEGELERSRKQLQQLADEQGILRPRSGGDVQIRELTGEHLLAEFAPDASFAKARHLRRRLWLELRDRQRLAFLVEATNVMYPASELGGVTSSGGPCRM